MTDRMRHLPCGQAVNSNLLQIRQQEPPGIEGYKGRPLMIILDISNDTLNVIVQHSKEML